ncbi:MAG: ComF family protein [Eubacteriales bacterium]
MAIKILDSVLELIFPSDIYCICCGNLINAGKKYSLCEDCIRDLDWVNAHECEKCGVKLKTGEKKICKTCVERTQNFDRAYTCLVYDDMAKKMITEYKFNGKSYMADALADIMVDKFLTSGCAADLVIFVPMHPKKERQRGYNQAELLARKFAKKLDLPVSCGILLRKGYKKAMSKLRAEERADNIKGVYAISEDIKSLELLKRKSVILVDDIYTTGTTANECARLLKEAGAESVSVFTLAAGADS